MVGPTFGPMDMPPGNTFEIGTQIILLQIDGFLRGWILSITPLNYFNLSLSQEHFLFAKGSLPYWYDLLDTITWNFRLIINKIVLKISYF